MSLTYTVYSAHVVHGADANAVTIGGTSGASPLISYIAWEVVAADSGVPSVTVAWW